MLTSLTISNYALIDALQLDLHEGMSVITGETGAGKSILLGALGLLQGNRAETKAIKSGAKKCVVEATFNTQGLDVDALLAEADVDAEEQLIVRREITAAGKSRAFLNDTPVNLATLRAVSDRLIDIHSQHQNLLLSHETFLLDTLDAVAANVDLREHYAQHFATYEQARKQLDRLQQQAQRNAQDEEFLRFQLAQIDDEQLQEDEQELLEEESQRLTHAEDIKTAFYRASNALSGDESNVIAALRSATQALESVARYLPQVHEMAERLHSTRVEIDDIANDIEREADHIEVDPQRLEWVDERLSTIYRLQRKHQADSIAQLLALAEEWRTQLEAIDHAEEHIAEAKAKKDKAWKQLQASAQALTQSRQQAAHELEQSLVQILQNLGMPHVQLQLDLSPRPQPDSSGADALCFRFSANKQVPPQEVAAIASGGEIARLMLALKTLIAQKKHLPTIIFDEIDTGVSGTMAEKMGRLMQQMAQGTQVICITHLPQIAALGAEHFLVYKQEHEQGTSSHIVPLDDEARLKEIANMLSGAAITQAAIDNARELLQLSS